MYRALVPLVLLLVLAAPAAAKEPPLIGGPAGGPYRLLDRDLRVIPGSPKVPARATSTVLSPSGERFAAYGLDRITIFDRRRVPPLRTLGSRGWYVRPLWLDARHLLQQRYTRPDQLRSIDVRSGRTRARVLRGIREVQPHGARARVLASTRRATSVVVVDALARVRRRIAVDVPPAASPDLQVAHLSGDTVYAQSLAKPGVAAGSTYRVGVVGGAMREVDLPAGFYRLLSPTLLSDPEAGRLIRIDPARGTVVKAVATPPGVAAPLAGGAVIGIARAVFDRALEPVADLPGAPAYYDAPVLHAGRLYARVFACEGFQEDGGLVVVDPRTGAVLARRPGFSAVGELGDPYLLAPTQEDCD